MIKITDIANMAGVSKATVSRAINNSGYVAPETKKKIMYLVNKYNYVQYAAAVALSTQDSKLLAVVIPEIDNVFYGEILKGVTEMADRLGYTCMLYDTRNSLEVEEQVINAIKSQRVRGIILGPSVDYNDSDRGKKLLREINGIGVPIVVVDRDFEGMKWDAVLIDNYRISHDCAAEFCRLGYKRLAVISGDLKLKIGRDRLNGFLDGAREAQRPVKACDIWEGDFLEPKAYELSLKLLDQETRPDAVFLSNNRTTLGFLKAAHERGVKVGEEIHIIGFDYIPTLDAVGVQFSTVYRDVKEMGRMAAKLLQSRILKPEGSQVIRMVPSIYRFIRK